jgi:hypothetical protein
MGTRGRSSSAELTVIGPRGIETIRRPDPPKSLTDEQAAEWRKVVNGMAADHFPVETHALLEQRCRHVIWGRRLAQAVDAEEKSPDFGLKRYRDLLRSAAEQSHARRLWRASKSRTEPVSSVSDLALRCALEMQSGGSFLWQLRS